MMMILSDCPIVIRQVCKTVIICTRITVLICADIAIIRPFTVKRKVFGILRHFAQVRRYVRACVYCIHDSRSGANFREIKLS